MIKSGRRPDILSMASSAVSRKLRCFMVGVGSAIIIRGMATCTSIWRFGIIAVVAGSTVIGYFSVSTSYSIILIVSREGSRTPSRSSGVTGSTISGNTQNFMVRIERCVKIRLMASVASLGRVDIPVGMTLDAVIGDGSMSSGKRIKSAVVKSRGCPDILGVASGTIS